MRFPRETRRDAATAVAEDLRFEMQPKRWAKWQEEPPAVLRLWLLELADRLGPTQKEHSQSG